jgi:hypothetical protein
MSAAVVGKVSLYIHVGLHKTGTTFLQRSVFPNWPGVHYVGKPYSDQFFEPALRDEGIACVLLSNEQFSSPPIYPDLLDPCARKRPWFEQRNVTLLRLKQLFPEAGVIMGFRHPVNYCESVYSQYIFRGGAAGLDSFWHPSDMEGCLGLEDVSFDKLQTVVLDLWSEVFFFDHADLRSRPYDLLWAMAEFMGVDNTPEVVPGEVNPRLSKSQIAAMQAYSAVSDRQKIPSREFYRGLRAVRDSAQIDEPFTFSAYLQDEITRLTKESWRRAKLRMALQA